MTFTPVSPFAALEVLPAAKLETLRTNQEHLQGLAGAASSSVVVPAFSLPAGAGPTTILPTATLPHAFTGDVIVEADLTGDAAIGANTSVRFLLTVNGVTRFAWAQNFSAGTVRDSPNPRVVATVAAATPVQVSVACADIGSGGTSGSTGSLVVQWVIRAKG